MFVHLRGREKTAMIRSTGAAVAALLLLGAPAVARAQVASDSAAGLTAAPADTATLDQQMALEDSTRALLAQDDSQTQLDQARLDSLQAELKSDRSSAPRAKAAPAHDQAAVAQTRRAVRQDLKRDKATRERLTSIEKTIKKEQAPTKKAMATARAVRPAAGSH
jgi:hypothetical protein